MDLDLICKTSESQNCGYWVFALLCLKLTKDSGDLKNVCCWAIESVERDYGQIPFATESLLLCHRFDTPKSTLPEPSTQTMMPLHIASNNTNGDTQNAHDYPIPTETVLNLLIDFFIFENTKKLKLFNTFFVKV